MKKYLFILVCIIAGVFLASLVLGKTGSKHAVSSLAEDTSISSNEIGLTFVTEEPTITITTPTKVIYALFATSTQAMERGLGMRDSIPDDFGMLFTFDELGRHGFWMKDMRFPIDIIWLNAQKRVVYLREKVDPSTFPNIFVPTTDSLYVLEINAGKSREFGIATGTVLSF